MSGISLAEVTCALRRLRAVEVARLDVLERPSDSAGPKTQAATVALRHVVSEIDAALGRIDDGSYGACHHCGTMIAFSRLAAVPYTRYCEVCA